MTIILSVLNFLLFIGLIVGLIKPSVVLGWNNKPTRLKVFAFWFLATVMIIIVGVATESDEDRAKSGIKVAKEYIENENYASAISQLEDIKEGNSFYPEAQTLLHLVDSLGNVTDEEKRVAREEDARKAAEEEILKQQQQLEKEIESVNDGVDFSTYRQTVDALQMELVLFGAWAKMIKAGEDSDHPEIQKLAKKLKSKVVSMQVAEFPKLRKEYAKIVAGKMWENDIEVYSNGTGNRNINFSGGIFAANKNKKEFQNQIHDILKMFRFRQARYRWYQGAGEYTYWTVYEGKDAELVTFKE